MRFIPDFLTEILGKKPSENFVRASERAKQRRAHELNFDNLIPDPSSNPAPVSEKPASRFSGLDVRTLVLAVSLMANAGLAGVLYGKSAATEENELLKKEVDSLRVEKAKMSRASEGKIALAPNQIIITTAMVKDITESSRKVIETNGALSSRVAELEGRLAKYEGKKRAAGILPPEAQVGGTADSVPASQSSKYAKASEAVKIVSKDLPDGVSLKVVQNAGLTAVTYSDTSGFTRYFTAERSENASKLHPQGLQKWVNEKYMASLDAQAKKEGTLR